uniref:Putative secreted protein n=1 Tax=Anopheles triannulatus TaxID=58253 RepID=A0A2M4B5I8_9DIPT
MVRWCTLCFCIEGAVEGALALLDGVGGISSLLRIRRVRSENRLARCRNRTVTKSFPFAGIISDGLTEFLLSSISSIADAFSTSGTFAREGLHGLFRGPRESPLATVAGGSSSHSDVPADSVMHSCKLSTGVSTELDRDSSRSSPAVPVIVYC